jgi:Amt family ammonium transporter
MRLAAILLLLLAAPAFAQEGGEEAVSAISGADTAWILISMGLVLLMTPGLAFFYGGMVTSRNALNTMMMSFVAFAIAGILWVVAGYSIAFGPGTLYFGDFSMVGLKGVGTEASGGIPHLLFMGFQATFAIITAALISGAVVGRMRFPAYIAFIGVWGLLVYAPVAHWVWGGGWLGAGGFEALDFAGGAVVHINAGIAALVAALVLGARRESGRQAFLPHNVPFVLLGAGLLWFGWFGFTGGSALAANEVAALASVNTLLAPMATLLVWVVLDSMRCGKITAVGAATGIVVGLVAVTPAAGFVSPMGAILIGAIAAVPSFFLLHWRAKSRLDDSLDVFAAHGVGGISGALLTGVFANAEASGAVDGLLRGNPGIMVPQIISILAVIAYSGVMTFLILKTIGLVLPLRGTAKEESLGMDLLNHGEEAYASGEGAVLLLDEEINGSAVKF